MENLILAICLYIVAVALCYQPRHTETPAPAIAVKPEPVKITEPLPVAPFRPVPPVKTPAMSTETQLMNQPIRSLKSFAKGRVKNYSSLTKAQLSQRLAGIVPLAELT
jgi:hypothetical protein